MLSIRSSISNDGIKSSGISSPKKMVSMRQVLYDENSPSIMRFMSSMRMMFPSFVSSLKVASVNVYISLLVSLERIFAKSLYTLNMKARGVSC